MNSAPITVPVAEWKRHLCVPAVEPLRAEAQAGVERALAWVNEHGCPWTFVSKPVNLVTEGDLIRLANGTSLESRVLAEKLRLGQARSAVAVACSAGPDVSAEIQRLWDKQLPDKAFFLNAAAAACTEQLLHRVRKSICDQAGPAGLAALSHESPGYDGWKLGDQRSLLNWLATQPAWPGTAKLSLLKSGMLSPEHSQLALFGLGPSTVVEALKPDAIPCVCCSMDPCSYRRVPYASDTQTLATPGEVANDYAYPEKALRRWSCDLLTVESSDEQSVRATFRPDCKTCSNLGVPFGIDYSIELGPRRDGFPIRKLSCRPSDDDYQSMCSCLKDPERFPREMVGVPGFVDQPLGQTLEWDPMVEPAGCLCRQPSRDHKWKIALQTVHYKLHTNE